MQPQSQCRDRPWRLKVPEASPSLTTVTVARYVPACLRRAEAARWGVFLSWGTCWSVPTHAHHVSEDAHPNTPLGVSPALPRLCQGQAGAHPSEGPGDQAGWSEGRQPLALVRLQDRWSLASPVATWAPSAGKVSASSLGVTSAASVPLSCGKAGRGGGSPVLRHREEQLVTMSLRFSRGVTGGGFFWSQLCC